MSAFALGLLIAAFFYFVAGLCVRDDDRARAVQQLAVLLMIAAGVWR